MPELQRFTRIPLLALPWPTRDPGGRIRSHTRGSVHRSWGCFAHSGGRAVRRRSDSHARPSLVLAAPPVALRPEHRGLASDGRVLGDLERRLRLRKISADYSSMADA